MYLHLYLYLCLYLELHLWLLGCIWWYTPMCSRLILKSIRLTAFCLRPRCGTSSWLQRTGLAVPFGQHITLRHCSGLTRCMKCLNWCWAILPDLTDHAAILQAAKHRAHFKLKLSSFRICWAWSCLSRIVLNIFNSQMVLLVGLFSLEPHNFELPTLLYLAAYPTAVSYFLLSLAQHFIVNRFALEQRLLHISTGDC